MYVQNMTRILSLGYLWWDRMRDKFLAHYLSSTFIIKQFQFLTAFNIGLKTPDIQVHHQSSASKFDDK